jgi:dCTP deaminase
MGILTRDEILKEIHAGKIRIIPLDLEQVGPGSVDLRLSHEFRVFRKLRQAVHVEENIDLSTITDLIVTDQAFTLMPAETVLGMTLERISLPPYLCGWIQGRSRFARIGLLIHMTASFIQPGIDNRQVLEISNLAPFPLKLKPGTRLCQIIIERTEGEAYYRGTHQNQLSL